MRTSVVPPKLPSYPPQAVIDASESELIDYNLICSWAKLSVESVDDRLQRYIRYFTPRVDCLRQMVDNFAHELELGLMEHEKSPLKWRPDKCSFKMLDACVPALPTGDERGVFYALDFGGTNFRVVRAELGGLDGKIRSVVQLKQNLLQAHTALPRGLMDGEATATQLFDFFATTCVKLMKQTGDFKEGMAPMGCGFTFSFPCSQRSINNAVLIEWTKAFETGRKTHDPVEGLNVGELMNAAFQRNGVPLKVVAVVNDTVGTLLSAAYETTIRSPPVLVGLILGTGMNACYVDGRAPDHGYDGIIINLECGNFNRSLPLTNVDYELDFAESSNRGRQRLEKMVSGAYMGEIVRRAIIKVLQDKAPAASWIPFSLTSVNVARIAQDTSISLGTAATILMELYNHQFSLVELQIIKSLCLVVLDRGASLAAVIVAATARKSKHLQPAMGGVAVAVDGSVYKEIPLFQQQLRVHLENILGKESADLIKVVQADDGSGKGAAVLAAILKRLEEAAPTEMRLFRARSEARTSLAKRLRIAN